MLKPLTMIMFVSIGIGIVASLGFVMCGREPTYDIRPEPTRPGPVREVREPAIRANDRPLIYNPLEDM